MSQPLIDPTTPQRQFKGVWLCAAILDDEKLSPAAKILLAEIDSLTHPEKACYASNEFLAKRLHVTPVHMNGLLSDLTRAGYLIRLAFTGRQTLRCVHPTFSSNAETIHGLLSQYGVESPEGRPGETESTQGSLGKKPKAQAESRVGKKDKAALGFKTTPPLENTQPEISNTDTQKETTTTTRESAPVEASKPAGQAPSSSLSVGGISEEPSGDLSTEERLELDGILNDFGSDSRQKEKAIACAKRRDMAFVREQADIVGTNPKIENLAGAFEKACDSPQGWKRPKSAADKKQKRLPRAPEPEVDPEEEARRKAEEAAAKARHELQAKMWNEASLEQRQAWVTHAPSFYRGRFVIDGPPPNPFLLAALKEAMLPEAESKPPQAAAA